MLAASQEGVFLTHKRIDPLPRSTKPTHKPQPVDSLHNFNAQQKVEQKLGG